MKLTLVICLCFAAFASGTYVPASEVRKSDVKYADKEFLVKQKFLLEILRNVFEDLQIQEYLQYTKTYVTDEGKYNNMEDVMKFMKYYKNNECLKKGKIFTIMNRDHMDEVKHLYWLFYNCKDWDTFYRNVIWCRANCNEGIFIYALTMAVLHREDCRGIVLPAIYEIYPYYFVKADVMNQCMYRKGNDDKFGYHEDKYLDTVYSNYTKYQNYKYDFYGSHDLTHFTEDIGLNSWYYYLMMDYPSFIGKDTYLLNKDRRGELYLYQHQQLLARYYLERRVNGLGDIMDLDYECKIHVGYNPLLTYHNGLAFTPRMDNYRVRDHHHYTLEKVKDYEMRIRRAIDKGYVETINKQMINLRDPKAIDILGNMIQNNMDNVNVDFYRYLTIFSRLMLSNQDWHTHTYKLNAPGVLMHFETMLRDPVYYQLYKRIMNFYWQFKSTLPRYTFDDLTFKGVRIVDGTLDKIETYFEKYDIDVSNVMPLGDKEFTKTWDMKVMARQQRLNHKPFKYTINIQADTDKKAVLRVFMGAEITEKWQLQDYRKYMVEVDQYIVDLKSGMNKITRNTMDFAHMVRDRTTYTELYKKVMKAFDGNDKFPLDMSEAHCGIPDRLIFPMARKDNMNMQFFFVISDLMMDQQLQQYSTYDHVISCGVGSGSRYVDGRAMGYPFDRMMDTKVFYELKNKLVLTTQIRHLTEDKNRVM